MNLICQVVHSLKEILVLSVSMSQPYNYVVCLTLSHFQTSRKNVLA